MKKFIVSLCLVAVMALGTNAWASLTDGSLASGGSGLTTFKAINGEFSWDITKTGNLYNYTYIWAGGQTVGTSGHKRTADFIDIQLNPSASTSLVSSLIGSAQVYGRYLWTDLSDTAWKNITSTSSITSGTFTDSYGTAYTENMTALRFNPIGLGNLDSAVGGGYPYYDLMITFTTTLAPEWGNLFIQSGAASDGSQTLVFNTLPKTVAAVSAVPIPPAAFLFGSGLSGLFYFRRRRVAA